MLDVFCHLQFEPVALDAQTLWQWLHVLKQEQIIAIFCLTLVMAVIVATMFAKTSLST